MHPPAETQMNAKEKEKKYKPSKQEVKKNDRVRIILKIELFYIVQFSVVELII